MDDWRRYFSIPVLAELLCTYYLVFKRQRTRHLSYVCRAKIARSRNARQEKYKSRNGNTSAQCKTFSSAHGTYEFAHAHAIKPSAEPVTTAARSRPAAAARAWRERRAPRPSYCYS